MKNNVPFYRQDWNVENWKEMGFVDRNECEYWKNSSCGVLCLKMAIEGLSGKVSSVADYIDVGLKMGAYNRIKGWTHDGLTKLANIFGRSAKKVENQKLIDIVKYLDGGSLVLASIRNSFRERNLIEKIIFWKKNGGHLCLVIGYKKGKDDKITDFIVHHTSIYSKKNWKSKLIDVNKFDDAFTGRMVVVG